MGVVARDARRLSPAAQEDLRRRAVAAVNAGLAQAAVATVSWCIAQAVSKWVNVVARNGNGASGAIVVRADSTFYTAEVVAACRRGGAHFSLATGINPSMQAGNRAPADPARP